MTAVGVGSVNVMVDAAIGICMVLDALCGATAPAACVLAAIGDNRARLLWLLGDAGGHEAVNWTTLCDLRKAVLDDECTIAKSPLTSSSLASLAFLLALALAFVLWWR